MYEATQVAHIIVFVLLLLTREKLLAGLLLCSAIIYLSAGDYFLSFGRDVYLIRALIDIFIAYIIFYGARNHIQPLILALLTLYNVAGYVEYPTSSYLVYNNYSGVTNGLNILQILVAWRLIGDAVGIVAANIVAYRTRGKPAMGYLQTIDRLPKAKE